MIPRNKERDLKAEIKRLEAENAFLRTQIQDGQNGQAKHLNDSEGYVSYLWELTKSNSLYKIIKRIANYFSRFRLISLVVKILGFIAVAIETSAFIFILIAALAFLLPPIIIGFLIILICSALRFHHDEKQIINEANDKKIIIFFPSRKYRFEKDSFFYRNAMELSQKDYCVIVVSPFIISPKGLSDKKKNFLNVKKEANGVFIIRQRYFFYIKKKFFRRHKKRLIYVY